MMMCRSETSEIPAFFTVFRYRNKMLSEEIVVSSLHVPHLHSMFLGNCL